MGVLEEGHGEEEVGERERLEKNKWWKEWR